ncbi:MAG: hypothetical protein NT047_00955 [Deltaproteobacteria bacterium]|nr:hypothetical protein [Deltaproteobacteria bacterium]
MKDQKALIPIPEDFMFRLFATEFENLESHFATSKADWGGRRCRNILSMTSTRNHNVSLFCHFMDTFSAQVIQANPKVLETAVIGVPDEVHGERVEAVVAFREELAEEELIAWCRLNLTDYKCPGRIHFVKEIPKTPAGKIVKAELRRRYAS